jgi:hypothetical protein
MGNLSDESCKTCKSSQDLAHDLAFVVWQQIIYDEYLQY